MKQSTSHYITRSTIAVIMLFAVLTSGGCASLNSVDLSSKDIHLAANGIKIGLVADSQFQTENSFNPVPLMRGKNSDNFIGTAIRPPALNYAALDMLKYFLGQFHKNDVDMVLYLGDAANNGCIDEVDAILKALNNFKRTTDIPVYFVIGNHDYLGAGNTSVIKDHAKLCSDNPGVKNNLSKYDLIEKVHQFNSDELNVKNSSKHKLAYKDSFSDLTATACGTDDSVVEEQHMRLGCYLSGILQYNKDGDESIDLLLLDTSDYFGMKPIIRIANKEYYGSVGWVSHRSVQNNYGAISQLEWFKKNLNKSWPKYRLIASHYPHNELGGSSYHDNENYVLRELFEPVPFEGNYWLSAHTHTNRPKAERIRIPETPWLLGQSGSGLDVYGLNIGSTSDYTPQAVIVAFTKNNNTDNGNHLAGQVITLDKEKGCEESMAYVKKQREVATLAGMDISYDKQYWTSSDTSDAKKWLDKIVSQRCGIDCTMDDSRETLVRACLGYISSYLDSHGIDLLNENEPFAN